MSSSSGEGEPDVMVDAFSRAVQQQDKQTLERLLKKRKKQPIPLPADDQNWTALHLAASDSEYEECLELILRYRDTALELDAQTDDGETPLFIACKNGCEKNALLLLHKGCDVEKTSSSGETALHIAASKGHTKIVEYLLDYSVNVECKDTGNFRPLHKAASNGHLEVCLILLQKGASLRSKNKLGQLPLHMACFWNRVEVARCLVERDPATVNFQNDEGCTPFMYAVKCFNVSAVRYLLENGARVDTFSKGGDSALHYAIGNAKVFPILLEHVNVTSFESKWLDTYNSSEIRSLLSFAVDNARGDEFIDLLFKSNLPKRFLEMPDVSLNTIYSPLACIMIRFFSTYPDLDFVDDIMKRLDSCLHLLLKQEIVFVKFVEQLKEKYPDRVFYFYHPFSKIFSDSSSWPREKQLRYFNLLNTNGVTTDYCLQCYRDNTVFFNSFVCYVDYYEPVLSAAATGNVEALKLFLSNSAILEPDILLAITEIKERCQVPYCAYEYLTLLKPDSSLHEGIRSVDFQVSYTYFNAKDRFSRCTLLQLCRTAVRRQLREPTLEDNLKNFRRKISELPIPVTLKEYLLFKI